MGHIAGKYGVHVNPKKIRTMQEWSYPKTLKRLHRFVGLTRCYRKFINKCGKNVDPLTSLVNKNSFSWKEVVEQPLFYLNQAMFTTHVLVMLDFI